MTDLSFAIPPAMLDWLNQQVADGRYVDAGDFLRDLLRRQQEEAEERVWLRAQIEEGEASGICDEGALAVLDRLIEKHTVSNG